MFHNIIVPLDESHLSRAAIPYALALAEPGGDVSLVSAVHVAEALSFLGFAGDSTAGAPLYGPGTQMPSPADLLAAVREERERALQDIGTEVQTRAGGPIRWEVVEGEPSEAVAAYVQGIGAGLVVMATHGRGGFERAWLGSVADRLIRRLTVPMLLIRPDETASNGQPLDQQPVIRRILVPLDGSRLAEAALGPATAVARRLDASVRLLRVLESELQIGSPYLPAVAEQQEQHLEAVRSRAKHYLAEVRDRLIAEGVRVEPVDLREGPAAATILDATGADVDMVAMATHGRGGLRRWVLGSVSDKVLRREKLPLLLVRPGDGGEAE